MATTSVTLRIPNDILEQLPQARGERSRALVDLLKKGLSLPTGDEKLNKLIARIEKVEKCQQTEKAEAMKWQSDIVKRLAELELPKADVGEKRDSTSNTKVESSETLSLFSSSEPALTKEENLANKAKVSLQQREAEFSDDIPEGTEQKVSGELLKILRKEDPESKWTSSRLASYRSKKSKDKWFIFGHCKFKYSHQKTEGRSTRDKQHVFYVIYPLSGLT